MKVCRVTGCDKNSRSRGWCPMHYERWRKTGDPNLMKWPSIREAFDLRTEWQGGCLVWTGALSSQGYGQQQFRGRAWLAHRIAWTLVHGEIPEGMWVNHVCWNPTCVNVDHLNLSTPSENGVYRGGPNRNNTSGFRNVTYVKRDGTYKVEVQKDGKRHAGHGFKTAEEASVYAEQLRQRLNGKFAGNG